MSDIALYQPTGLPPATAGQAKPPYELADRSGQRQAGQMLANFAGKLFDDVVTRRANREHAEFVGFANTEIEKFRTYVAKNPGLPFEEYENQINEAVANIQAASEQATTGSGADANAQWTATNLSVAQQRMLTDATQELHKYERQRAAEALGKFLIDTAISRDPEGNPVLDKQGNPTYDWNNAKAFITNPAWLKENGISLTDATSMLTKVMSQVKQQQSYTGDPYTVRQDEKAYFDMLFQLDTNPESVTLADLKDGVPDKWTTKDYEHMRKMLPTSEHYDATFQNDPIIKRYFQTLRNLYPEEEELTSEQRQEYTTKSYELRQALKDQEGDAAAMEKEYQRISDMAKEEQANRWIAGYWKLYSWSPGGIIMSGLRRRTMIPTITDVSQTKVDFFRRVPKTIDEFNVAVMALDEEEAKEYFEKYRSKFGI